MWKFSTLLLINGVELLPAMPGSGGATTINCAQCLKKRTAEQKILRNREKGYTADYENSAHFSTNDHPPEIRLKLGFYPTHAVQFIQK